MLRSLLDAAVGDYPARVVAVGVDRDCRAAQIAADAGIPSYCERLRDYPDRLAWDAAIAASTALPPAFKISTAAATACGFAAAAIASPRGALC